MIVRRLSTMLALAALGAMIAGGPAAQAFDPATEAQNFSKTQERETIWGTPQYQLQLRLQGQQNQQRALEIALADPERNFHGQLCATGEDGCAGDVRLYDWEEKGYGIVEPVLFTARSGATISGHVWATRSGPSKRPGIVITNGSVQAPEQLYWFAAQTLAKAGYVVLTSDPQNQGQSDNRGEAPDENEGFPAQSDGRPFFDGTADALDFFLSTPKNVYKPRISCDSGTSHAPKHSRRVEAGLNAAYNPFWNMLNPQKIGLAGHSFGAGGVSYVGQKDPRVSAIVAWDNLGPASVRSGVKPCPFDPESHADAQITKPALGMAADYGLTPTPFTADPDPLAKSQASLAYSAAGVDTGQLVHPRRHALRVQLHPEPGVRRHAARGGPGRLVHDRVVRQVREARLECGQAPADDALEQRRGRGRDRPRRRRQHVLVLLPLAPGHQARQRPVQVRGHPRGLCRHVLD